MPPRLPILTPANFKLAATGLGLFLAVLALWFLPLLPVKLLTITSASMAPALPPGSAVLSTPYPVYQPGEIIVFRQPNSNQLVTHRVVNRLETGQIRYFTKGDANQQLDGRPVPATAVLGKVVFFTPLLGYFILWAQSPLGLTLLIFIPSAYLIYDSVKRLT